MGDNSHMEVLNSALLGVVGSLLRKLHELQSTTEDGARQLSEDLGSIRTKLEKLSEVHDPTHTLSYWMKHARELFYDMEDFVDNQSDEASGADRINQLISRFKTRVDELKEKYTMYNFEDFLDQTTNTLASHRLSVVHGREHHPVVLVGIDGPANHILQWLKPKGGDSEKQLKVGSIHGVDGVGKSTLAQAVWRKLLESDFDCRAFIQTAKKPDMRMILTNILSQVRPERAPGKFQVQNLIQDIREHLHNKRYFIVIDDIWTVSVWDVLRHAFPDSNCSSRIIITTTAEDIALACCSYDDEYIFRMKPLSGDDSKRTFISTAFGSGNGCPPQVNDNLDEITRKCGGLPLALTCLASVVASLPKTEQLEYFKFLRNNLRTNSSAMEVLNFVLKLCYNSLPHSLKTCLLYLSVYPMSYAMLKEDLVKQWIAEGFICSFDGKDIEEVAMSYFDMLVNLNLIQQMDISNHYKKRVSYRVHPVVYYFITCNSLKDNFITVIDYTQSTVVLTDKIRRLALHFGSATAAAKTGLSQVRSFAFMGLVSCMPSLVEFKLVRVVILHFQGDHRVRKFSLTKIRELLLLRYLQVRSSVTTVILPDQLQCLEHLETLEINAVVAAVPLDIVNHPSLKHVCLGRKKKHNHLSMGPDNTSGQAVFEKVSGRISSASLQKLQLLPPICSFSRLPAWVQKLRGLRILEIVVRELWMYDPEFLSELPFLTALTLYVRKPTAGRTTVTFRGGAFPVLKYLKLVSGSLLLNFREKAVCKLEKLKIGFNTHGGENFGQMLGGTHHLLKLQVIVASIGAAVESDMIAVESALREAISKHPCPPSFKVKRVEKPFDEECDPLEMQISCKDAGSSSEQIRYPTVQMQHSEIQEEDSSIGQSEILPRKLPTDDIMGIPAQVPPRAKELAAGPRTSSAAAYQEPHMEIGIRSAPIGQTETMLDVLSSMMDSLLRKLRGLLELPHALPPDVLDDIKLIHLRLVDMREIIGCLNGGYMEWQSIKDWFNDCRELALDIEDFVDLCTLWIDPTAAFSKNDDTAKRTPTPSTEPVGTSTFSKYSIRNLARMMRRKFETSLAGSGASRENIFRDLENLKQRAVEQEKRLRELPRKLGSQEKEKQEKRLRTLGSGIFVPYRIDNEELVGMAGPLKVVSHMVMEDTAERKIIFIVGMAGSGKTTLAAEVYRKLGPQGYFQHCAFISGRQEANMFSKNLIDMILQFDNKHQGHDSHDDNYNTGQLIRRVADLLENKRYLIVVDDLWSMEQWLTIKHFIPDYFFPKNYLGSRIIVTTRNPEVARSFTGFSQCVYKMGLLSDSDSESLFMRRVFGTEQGCPKHLEAVSAQIIRRCGGLPLALISAASSLKNSPPTQEEWERHTLNFLSSSDGKYMMQIVSLSYDDLSPHLKTFMLYLSIFPEHYEVDIECLMRRWIAEGFIRTIRAVSAVDRARSHLQDLIRINMIQPLHPKHNGIPRYCRVDPVMHDFIVYRALEENFVTLVDDRRQDVPTNNGPVRRLSHQRSSNRDQDGTQIDLSHTRSITVFGQANAAPLLTSQLRVVRVLDLEGCGGPVCLDGLHELLLLRYLSLRGTDVSELPEEIGELRCLETLDVRSTNVKELPDSIVSLQKLMHLLAGSAKLPNGMSKMKALQTLSGAVVTNALAGMVKELSELEDLRELGLLSCDLTEEEPGDGKHVKFPAFGFDSLRQLCIQGWLSSVTFEPRALEWVETLELKFTGCITEESGGGIFGVENLRSLKHVLLEFSQHDDSVMAIADTVRKAAAKRPFYTPPAEVTVIVDGRPLDSFGEKKSRPMD